MARELLSMNPLPPEVVATGQVLSDLAEYAGSPQLRTLDTLLAGIEDDYLQRLRTVDRDGLAWLQGALAQVEALRSAIHGRSNGRV